MLKLNRVIIYLTTSDIFTWGLLTVINGFAGLYLATKLELDVVQVVGLGMGIFSLAKGLFQIPIGLLVDQIKKDTDDIFVLFFGNLLMGAPFLFYPLIQSEYFYYLLQFLVGTGAAMNLVTWRKMFARNVDVDKEGLQYGIYDTIMSFSIALFSLIAGSIANISQDYFDLVMLSMGILILSSGIWALSIFKVQNRRK